MPMMRSRLAAQVIAAIRGYFWLPCPICGQDFAGFEHGPDFLMETASVDGASGKVVCARASCQKEARRRNLESFPAYFQHPYFNKES